MVRASVNPWGEWVIRKVVLDHSGHVPKPSDAKLVKEYRMQSLTPTIVRKVLSDYHSGIPIAKIYTAMSHKRGGFDNMPHSGGFVTTCP